MNTSPQQLPRGLQKPLEWAEDTNQATRVDGPSESAAPSGALALASCWALRSLADHLAKVTSTVRTHGGHGWTYEDEIAELHRAAAEIEHLRGALAAILHEWQTQSEACADNSAVAHRMAQLARKALWPNTVSGTPSR